MLKANVPPTRKLSYNPPNQLYSYETPVMITDFPQKSHLEGLLRLTKMSPGLDKFIWKSLPPINLFMEEAELRQGPGWYKMLKLLLRQF